MSFTLYVHVGSGKAGSSAIQKALLQHAKKLAEKKVKYLGLMLENMSGNDAEWKKPYGWPVYLSNSKKYKNELLLQLEEGVAELVNHGYKTAVWSNESLFGQVDLLRDIKALGKKAGFNVKIICYFRNHTSWAISAYKQWGIKHKSYSGPIKPFSEWSKERPVVFSVLADRWSRDFKEDFIIKNYDADKNLVSNFFNIVNPDNNDFLDVDVVANKTPDRLILSLWALYNNQFSDEVLPNQLEPLLQRSGILNHDIVGVSLDELFPSDSDVRDLNERCKDDLASLNAILTASGEPNLKAPESLEERETVTSNDLIAALLFMLEKHDKEIRQLKQKLKNLEAN